MAPRLIKLLSASPGMQALTETSRYLRRAHGRVEPELAQAIQAAYHSLPWWRRVLLMLDALREPQCMLREFEFEGLGDRSFAPNTVAFYRNGSPVIN